MVTAAGQGKYKCVYEVARGAVEGRRNTQVRLSLWQKLYAPVPRRQVDRVNLV